MMVWKEITKQMVNRIQVLFLIWVLVVPTILLGQTPTPDVIRVEPASRTIEPGDAFAFRAIGVFADRTEDFTDRVAWSTDNRRIAEITDNGVVTGIRSGFVEIIARFGDLVGRADLRVADVTNLRIAPAGATIDLDEFAVFQAFAIFGDNGQEVRVTEDADWESSNESVASVTEVPGVIRGDRAGSVSITARLGDQSDTVALIVNTPPIAGNDQTTTMQDTPVTLTVTSNDNDPDPNDTIVPATVDLDPSTPGRQTVWVVADQGRFVGDDGGNVVFTPESGFVGVSMGSYTVEDSRGSVSNEATVTVTVTAVVNTPPLAVDDRATTEQDTPVTFSVTQNDRDPDGSIVPSTVDLDPSMAGRQTAVGVTGEGSFVVDDVGNVTFTPEPGFTGESVIVYTVQDNQGLTSNIATITVVVDATEPPNQPPVAVDDNATTPLGTPVTLTVTTNDNDPDGAIDPATVDLNPNAAGRQSIFSVPGQGTFTVDDLGNVTFAPVEGFIGTSTIAYTVEDDQGLVSNPATITVSVFPVAEPSLGVAKAAEVSDNAVVLTLRIENFGNVALSNLSLSDDLDATFGAGNYTVGTPSITVAPETSVVVLNPGYTGAAGLAAELLDAVNSTLAVNEFAEILVPVTVTAITDQGNGVGVYMNTAIGGGGAAARCTGSRDRCLDRWSGSRPQQ